MVDYKYMVHHWCRHSTMPISIRQEIVIFTIFFWFLLSTNIKSRIDQQNPRFTSLQTSTIMHTHSKHSAIFTFHNENKQSIKKTIKNPNTHEASIDHSNWTKRQYRSGRPLHISCIEIHGTFYSASRSNPGNTPSRPKAATGNNPELIPVDGTRSKSSFDALQAG